METPAHPEPDSSKGLSVRSCLTLVGAALLVVILLGSIVGNVFKNMQLAGCDALSPEGTQVVTPQRSGVSIIVTMTPESCASQVEAAGFSHFLLGSFFVLIFMGGLVMTIMAIFMITSQGKKSTPSTTDPA